MQRLQLDVLCNRESNAPVKCDKCGMQFKGEIVYPVFCKCGAVFDAPGKVRGLGDRIAQVTKAVGIKPCRPCKKRQDALNKRFPSVQPPAIITVQQLNEMARKVASSLRPRSHIVAIPRSGMLPASIMATLTDGQLWQKTKDRIEPVGSGLRYDRLVEDPAMVYLVDDSIWSGMAMGRAAEAIHKKWPKAHIERIALISHSDAVRKVEQFHSVYNHHFFEWNYANGPFAGRIAWDMDGILCEDFTAGDVKTETKYLKAMWQMPTTTIRPVKHPLTIITARPERFRLETMKWLTASRFRVENLIMAPWTDIDGHDADKVARWKADEFNKLLDEKTIYVESDRSLAHGIFQHIKRGTVLSVQTNEVLIKT